MLGQQSGGRQDCLLKQRPEQCSPELSVGREGRKVRDPAWQLLSQQADQEHPCWCLSRRSMLLECLSVISFLAVANPVAPGCCTLPGSTMLYLAAPHCQGASFSFQVCMLQGSASLACPLCPCVRPLVVRGPSSSSVS